MVKRDRNKVAIVVWSHCNEYVRCQYYACLRGLANVEVLLASATFSISSATLHYWTLFLGV